MNTQELSEYYRLKRKKDFERKKPLRGIKLRRRIHLLPLNLLKLDRALAREKLTVLVDHRREKGHKYPVIYVCTHIGSNDIQRIFEAIEEHAYLFLGDPRGAYRGEFGFLLFLNGAICLETRDKADRHIAKERAIELLKRNGSLMIFPEGAWNPSPQLLVMKIFKGTAEMLQAAHAIMVPVAIEQYECTYYVNIGEEYDFSDSSLSTLEITERIREILATLRWQIWESRGIFRRKELGECSIWSTADKKFLGYEEMCSIQDVLETMYVEKNTMDDGWVKQLKEELKKRREQKNGDYMKNEAKINHIVI